MIGIINYGLGNILAYINLLNRINVDNMVISNVNDLNKVKKIILPGVGHFDQAMNLLEHSGMLDKILHLVKDKKFPILGICVGMQILADSSEEGKKSGLGLIRGKVKKLKTDKTKLILPHLGWNEIKFSDNYALFKNMKSNPQFYFLHSYYFECSNKVNEIANFTYGEKFCCAVKQNNIYGVQFHPEKSHSSGVQLIKNFSEINHVAH